MCNKQIDYQSYVGKIFIHFCDKLNTTSIVYIISYDRSQNLFKLVYIKTRNDIDYKHLKFNPSTATESVIFIWIKRSTFNNDCADEWKTVIV